MVALYDKDNDLLAAAAGRFVPVSSQTASRVFSCDIYSIRARSLHQGYGKRVYDRIVKLTEYNAWLRGAKSFLLCLPIDGPCHRNALACLFWNKMGWLVSHKETQVGAEWLVAQVSAGRDNSHDMRCQAESVNVDLNSAKATLEWVKMHQLTPTPPSVRALPTTHPTTQYPLPNLLPNLLPNSLPNPPLPNPLPILLPATHS